MYNALAAKGSTYILTHGQKIFKKSLATKSTMMCEKVCVNFVCLFSLWYIDCWNAIYFAIYKNSFFVVA